VWPNRGAVDTIAARDLNVLNVLPARHRIAPGKSLHEIMTKKLRAGYFARSVHEVAPALIGATLTVGGCSGRIVEVEAYHQSDPAAHSYNGVTPRNFVMFGSPGRLYVYRSYGIHWCMNVICEPAGQASAVLIRAIEPLAGLDAMRRRRGLPRGEDATPATDRLLCSGPGRLCQALGVTIAHNGLVLDAPPFAIHPATAPVDVVAGPRIGITRAVDYPWRYGLRGSRFLSKPFKPEFV
jgi:DNA-3-methyladenine glycosylase